MGATFLGATAHRCCNWIHTAVEEDSCVQRVNTTPAYTEPHYSDILRCIKGKKTYIQLQITPGKRNI